MPFDQKAYDDLENQLSGGALGEATQGAALPAPEAAAAPPQFGPPPPPESRAAALENVYGDLEDALGEQEAAWDAQTSELFQAAFSKAPTERAAITEIATKTKTDPALVEQRLPEFRAAWEASKRDPRAFREANPELWKTLFDHPQVAPIAVQDEQISWVRRLFRGVADWSGDHPLLTGGANFALPPDFSAGEIMDLEDQMLGRDPEASKAARTLKVPEPKKNVPYELDPSAGMEGFERYFGRLGWVPYGTDGQVDLQIVQPGIFGAAWANTRAESEYSKAGFERMALRQARMMLNPQTAAPAIADLDRRIWEADKQAIAQGIKLAPKTYGQGPWEQLGLDAATVGQSQAEVLAGAGKYGGGAAAIAGGLTLLATRSPGTALKVGRKAWKWGSRVGGALTSFELESGSFFNDAITEKLDDGTFVDENVATGGAIIYGAIASAIEMEAMGKFMSMAGPLGDAIKRGEGKAFMKGLLRDGKIRSILADVGKRWLKGAYAEGQEEFLQQEAQEIIDYAARSAQAGGWQKADPLAALDRGIQAGESALAGTLVLGAPMAGVTLTTHLMTRERAIRAGQRVAAVVKLGQDSLTAKASPEFVADLIERESTRSGEPVTNLYVSAPAFVKLFETQDADPQAAARELMGEEGPARLQAALAGENQGKIEVPVAEFLEKWGDKPVAQALAADMATRPGLATTRELLEEPAKVRKQAEALADGWLANPETMPQPESEAEQRLVDTVEQQLQRAKKYTPENARKALAVTRAFLRTQAEVWGVSPDELFDHYTTTVDAQQQAATPETAAVPAATRRLQPAWETMSQDQRRNAMWLDWNTGVLNERAFRALPADPARPFVAVFEPEGTKWANKSGHAAGNALYRAAAVALHAADPEVAKVGGRFVVRVADQAAASAILAKAQAAMPAGLQLTGTIGTDLASADAAHVTLKQAAEAAGTRAPRGERPAGLPATVASAADLRLPGTPVVGAALPAALAGAEVGAAEGFNAVYVEPGTRLLTGQAFWALPRRPFLASLDLRFLKAINAQVGEPGGDAALQVFGTILAAAGGHEFDAAHLHGDEYVLQGEDEVSLRGFLDKVRAMSEDVVIRLEDEATGEVVELQGLHFEDGIGSTYDDAERELEARKSQRDASVEGTRFRVVPAEEAARDGGQGGRAGSLVRGLPAGDARGALGQGYVGAPAAPDAEAVAAGEARARAAANGWTYLDPREPVFVPALTPTEVVQANLSREAEAVAERIAAALEDPSPAPDAEVVPPITAATRFNQVQDIPTWEARVQAWMENQGYSKKEVARQLEAMRGQMKIFAALGPVELKELPAGREKAPGPAWTQDPSKFGKRFSDAPQGPLRSNQDSIYVLSFDLSAMCVKRLEAAATAAWVQEKLNARRAKKGLAPRSLDASERMALAALFRESGKAAPCLYCYVEAPRAKASEFVDEALKIAFGDAPAKPEWSAATRKQARAAAAEVKKLGLTTADVNPLDITDSEAAALPAAAAREARAPKTYEFLRAMASAAKQNQPKLYESYSGQLLNVSDEFIQQRNEEAGFRFFSSSDFQFEHVADLMQAFSDLALRQARSHAYTKVVEYVEIFGATGQKIQTSIFAKRDEAGNIVEDTWQGMGWADAQRLREKFPDVGTVLVATDDDIVRWGLEQPWVDYIIPFHHSGLESRFFVEMGWKSYQATQSEKVEKTGKSAKGDLKIRMHDLRVAGGVTNEELTKRYLREAKKRGLVVPFAQFSDHPQYAKLRKDYARTDTPFRAVQPVFDLKKAKAVLDKYFAGEAAGANVDRKIGTKLVDMIESAPEGVDIGVEALKASQQSRDIVTAIGKRFNQGPTGEPPKLRLVKDGETAKQPLGSMAPSDAWDALIAGADPSSLTDDQILGLLAWNDPQGEWDTFHDAPRLQEELKQKLDALAKDAGLQRVTSADLEDIASDPDFSSFVRGKASDLQVLADKVSYFENEFGGKIPSRSELIEALQREVEGARPAVESVDPGVEVDRIGAEKKPLTLEERRGRPAEKTAQAVQDAINQKISNRLIPMMLEGWPGIEPGPMGAISVLADDAFHKVLNATAWWVKVEPHEEAKRKKTSRTFYISTTGVGAKERAAVMVAKVVGDTLVVTPSVNRPEGFALDQTPESDHVGRAAQEEVLRALASAAWTLADDQGLTLKVAPKEGAMADDEVARLPLKFQKGIATSRRIETAMREHLGRAVAEQQKEKAKPDAEVTRLYQTGKKERAWVDVLKAGMKRVFKMMMTEEHDLSSFFHETAHTMLEMMGDLSERPDAPERIKQDYARALQFLGVANRGELKTEHHEKFARAFEAYLLEGRAPSATLAGIFQRFRLWLLEIYKSADALDVELNDSIRGVFDRMLATDAEIEKMKKAMGISAPMYASPAAAGMTPEAFQKYLEDREASLSHAARQVAAATARARAEQTQDWWDEKRAELRAEALAEFDRRQDARAFGYLKRGEVLTEDGRKVSAREMGRLDRAAVEALGLPKKSLEERLRGRLVKQGGEDPADVAARFDYGSAREMLMAVLNLPDRATWADQRADERMQERFSDVAAERDRLQEESAKALHSDLTSDWLLKEWVNLKRQSVTVMNPETGKSQVVSASTLRGHSPQLAQSEVPLEAIREAARIIAGKTKVGRINAGQALQAEGRAAEQAALAAAKGDFAQAYVFKQQQLLNHYLYRELADAKEAREKITDLAAKMADQKRRGVMGKATDPATMPGRPFRDASDLLLEALGLKEKETDPDALAERATMPEALKALEDAGLVPGFDAGLLASIVARPPAAGPKQAPWQGLTVDELKTVGMALAQLYTAARDAHLVKLEGKAVEIGALAADIRSEAERQPVKQQPPGSDSAAPRGWWMSQRLQGVNAALTDPEYLLKLLGPKAYRFFWNGYLEARQAEHELAEKVGAFFAEKWDALPEEMQRRRYDAVDARDLPLPPDVLRNAAQRDRTWAWMVWLNMGNRSNMERLLGGYQWDEKVVRDWLSRTLTKEEVDFLQGVLDLLDKELWPSVAAQYERVNGVRPTKIENLPWTMTFADGRTETYRGGYFPARYDPVASRVGRNQSIEEITKKYSNAGAMSVAKSFTKERVKKYEDVINLQWSVVPGHVAQVVHYVAFDSFVRDAARVMLHPETQAAISLHLGPKYGVQMEGWLHAVATANNDLVPLELEDTYGVIRQAKGAFVTATLGYSLSVAAGDLTNPLVAIASGKVKARYMTPSLLAGTNPLTFRAMRENAERFSKELPQRKHNMRTMLRRQLAEVGRQGKKSRAGKVMEAIRESAWVFMEFTDYLTSTIIWDGAFRQALAEGLSEKDAAGEADSAVRAMLPTHNAAEQPAFLRDKRGFGAITAFYGYFSKLYNVNREVWHEPVLAWDEAADVGGAARATASTAHAAGRMLAVFFVASVLAEFLTGRGPEDDEKYAEWVIRKLLASPFQLIPLLGPAGEAAINAAVSKAFHGKAKFRQFSMRASPAAAAVERVGKALARALDSKRKADQRFWDVVEVAAVGIPGTPVNIGPLGSNQITRTGRYVTSGKLAQDVRRGRYAEAVGGLVYGERDKGQGANPGTAVQKIIGR